MVDQMTLATEPALLGLVRDLVQGPVLAPQEYSAVFGPLHAEHAHIVGGQVEERLRLKMHLCLKVHTRRYTTTKTGKKKKKKSEVEVSTSI